MSVTPTAAFTELALTSNEDPSLNVIVESPTNIEYDFLAPDDVVFHKIYGRDHHVAFNPTEDRGVRFSLPVIIHAGGQPSSPGIATFDDIRAICTADLPYVCVLDHHGNRFYAKVQCPSGRHRLNAMTYIAVLTVTTLTDDPDPVTV